MAMISTEKSKEIFNDFAKFELNAPPKLFSLINYIPGNFNLFEKMNFNGNRVVCIVYLISLPSGKEEALFKTNLTVISKMCLKCSYYAR